MSRALGAGLFLSLIVASACAGPTYDIDMPPSIGREQLPTGAPRDYGPLVRADRNPPPVSGGTLLVTNDYKYAVAADSDRDQVYIVDLKDTAHPYQIVKLQQDDEPGRLTEDGAGRVHVVLRHAGAVVTIDPVNATVLARRNVCKIPRGITWDAAIDKLHVACASGELYTMGTTGDAAPTIVKIGDDLRDVVVSNGQLVVSRFRSADALVVDHAGKEISHPRLRPVLLGPDAVFDPAVAWRMRPLPKKNAVAMIHQRGGAKQVSIAAGGYSQKSGCGSSIVHSSVSVISSTGEVQESSPIPGSVLPVDFAISPDETRVVVVNAGNWKSDVDPSVQVFPMNVMLPPGTSSSSTLPLGDCMKIIPWRSPSSGHTIAVAFGETSEDIITQTREPAGITIGASQVVYFKDQKSVEDTGHTIFHLSAAVSGGVACASCHPEGGDDGRTWVFQGLGRRRTQTLRGGIMQTAPFHWAGDETDISALMNDVFAKRMGGGQLSSAHIESLSTWLDKVPASPKLAPINSAAADRGKSLFEGSAECTNCHTGSLLTNHKTVDVGTGAPFQVPVLAGIRFRSPFMHDGCAATLFDRFKPECGGGDKHGKTSQLSNDQIADLVAYLETL
jgi:DNA-binding beta-propeller fold protein YncE